MMEIDPIPYIFGSFARKRQSQDISLSKRRSVDPGVASTSDSTAFSASNSYVHVRTRSAPHQKTGEASASAAPSQPMEVVVDIGRRDEGSTEKLGFETNVKKLSPPTPLASTLISNINPGTITSQLKCPVCLGYFMDPRVLPCLHTYCLRCLHELEARDDIIWEDDSNNKTGVSGSSGDISATSDCNWSPPIRNRRVTCPSCGRISQLGPQGVNALPPNYTLQHRMILNTMNSSTTKLLCDLCTTHITAISRCSECAINLCEECVNSHKRQSSTTSHEILLLEEARRRGIKKVRKQIMCVWHPENELSTFCSTCSQVLCKDCTTTPAHYHHSFESVANAAKIGTINVRLALDRAMCLSHKSSVIVTQLQSTAERIENQCARVEQDIHVFMKAYRDAVDKHHQELIRQVQRAKVEKMEDIVAYTLELQKQAQEARDVATFTNELLREGEPVEVLTFARLIRDRVDDCNKGRVENGSSIRELQISENLQFLPKELMPTNGTCCPLYGVVTTRTVVPRNCVLNADNLKNLRVGHRATAILETRDRNNKPLQRGGEMVAAELHHSDSGINRTIPVTVEDLRDGRYSIAFTPDVAGKIVLTVYIKGHLIMDGPIPILVRSLRPHRGIYHCCTFCSSGGSKEVSCGCPGRMPGGYRGCGHGHNGHPGHIHWSCCGNVLEHSECARNNSTVQQFTL